MTSRAYTYSQTQPHAVTGLSTGESYSYDANGNQTCRMENNQTYLQFFNVENRMNGVWTVAGTCANPGLASATWQFSFDGDGNRVEQVYTADSSSLTTYYFAGIPGTGYDKHCNRIEWKKLRLVEL